MHANAFDRYHHGHSPLHLLDPRLKVVLTVAFILSNVLLPDGAWAAFGLAWMLVLAANLLSGLGMGFTLRRSFIVLPFTLAALTVLFSVPGNVLSRLSIGTWELSITDAGLVRFLSILVRSWLSIQAAILLVGVTEFPDLIHALAHLRVPRILTTIIAFLYRYLFVIVEQAHRMRLAGLCRGGLKRRSGGFRAAAGALGVLFARSYERAESIHRSMVSRGFQGHFQLLSSARFSVADAAFVCVAGGLPLAASLSARIWG